MGFYYGQSTPPPEKEPGGCLEVWVITRAVFGILAIPLLVLVGIVVALIAIIALFNVYWLLGLAGIAAIAVGVVFYARWERTKFRSGGG